MMTVPPARMTLLSTALMPTRIALPSMMYNGARASSITSMLVMKKPIIDPENMNATRARPPVKIKFIIKAILGDLVDFVGAAGADRLRADYRCRYRDSHNRELNVADDLADRPVRCGSIRAKSIGEPEQHDLRQAHCQYLHPNRETNEQQGAKDGPVDPDVLDKHGVRRHQVTAPAKMKDEPNQGHGKRNERSPRGAGHSQGRQAAPTCDQCRCCDQPDSRREQYCEQRRLGVPHRPHHRHHKHERKCQDHAKKHDARITCRIGKQVGWRAEHRQQRVRQNRANDRDRDPDKHRRKERGARDRFDLYQLSRAIGLSDQNSSSALEYYDQRHA